MKLILLSIVFTMSCIANNGKVLTSIEVERHNQYIISGTVIHEKKYNEIFIAKVDASLNLNEKVTLPQKKDQQAKALLQDANKNIVVVSTVLNDNNTNIRLTKLDPNNNVLWDTIYKNDNNLTLEPYYRSPIVQINDGNFLVLSQYQRPSRKNDILLYKIDKNGKKIWKKSFGTLEEDKLAVLLTNNDSTYSLFYMTELNENNIDIYALTVVKIDKNGKRLYSKRYFRTKQDTNVNLVLPGIFPTKNGGYILFGTARRITKIENRATKYILKIDVNGDVVWEQSIKDEVPFSKLVYLFKTDKDYVSFAMNYNSLDEPFISVVRFDDKGSVSKTEEYKELKILITGAIALKDKGFLIVGGRYNKKKKIESFVFKVDKNLKLLWTQQLETLPYVYGLPILKERPDGKVLMGYTYKKEAKSTFRIQLQLLDSNGTILKKTEI